MLSAKHFADKLAVNNAHSKEVVKPDDDKFEIIPESEWLYIPKDTYIKYQRTDGEIVKGGYVNSINTQKRTIYLRSTQSEFGATTWHVSLTNVSKIYKSKIFENNDDNIVSILNRLNQLENNKQADNDARIATLETEIIKIQRNIVSLHNSIQDIARVLDKIKKM